MDQELIEKTLRTLNYFRELFNIANELQNRIPKKHHEIINDQIIEIENIANRLMYLENELYYDYLKNEINEIENNTTSLTELAIGDMVNKILEKE